MIHRTMFLELLLLFSSAMRRSTTQSQRCDQVPREILRNHRRDPFPLQGFATVPAVAVRL